jgi:hypothetical protein
MHCARCAGSRARAGRGRGRSISTRATIRDGCASHRGRSAVWRRPGHGAQGRAAARVRLRAAAASARRVAARVYLGADGVGSIRAWRVEARGWPGLILVAGRYEGVDERFIEHEIDEQWSIGDYVLSGGELPALVVIDAIARLLPGALGVRSPRSRSRSRTAAGLAALHAAGERRRSYGARGVGVGRPCGHSALAIATGAGPYVVAAARVAGAARHERGRAGAFGRIQDRACAAHGRQSGHHADEGRQ